MKDKILKYLVAGLKPAQIATLVGCSPGHISQLMANEDFIATLKAMKLDAPPAVEDALADRYHGMESELLNAMRERMVDAELPAVTRALEVVAGIQDRRKAQKNPALAGHSISVNIVQLALPAHAIPQAPVIQLNGQSEIVAIDNMLLAPLSSGGVRELFAGIKASKEQVASLVQAAPSPAQEFDLETGVFYDRNDNPK